MKPFSKNLFSQTPVAFGWLPKETINLDISVCVCVFLCVCAWACLLCVAHKRVGEFLFFIFFAALFYQSHIQVCAKADQVEKGRSAKKLNNTTHGANNPPRIFATKTQHPPYHISLLPLTSFYTFTPTRSPNATPKHPSVSTPPHPSPPLRSNLGFYQQKV